MDSDQTRSELVARFVGAAFTLNVTDDAGVVGMGAEAQALWSMAYRVSRLEASSAHEWMLVDFAETTELVARGYWKDTDEWLAVVDLWRRQRAALLDIPAVVAVVPMPRDPSPRRPHFTEVHIDVDPIDAYRVTAAEEARRAYEVGQLPDAA